MSTTSLPGDRRAGERWFAVIFSLLLFGWTPGWAFGRVLPAPGQQSKPGDKPRQPPRTGNRTAGEPISKAALLKAVRLAAGSRDREERAELMGVVIQQVTAQGVDFAFSAEDETELREAGASPELLAAVRLKSEEQTDLMALRDWRAIKESRQAADFDAYLKKYPKSEFAPLARDRFEQLEWEALKASEKAADFEAFLQKHPAGKFTAPARERVEQLDWETIKASDSPADFEAYLKKYPEGKFVAPARERREQLEWEAIKASEKAADFETFLQKYPSGKFTALARERVEQLEWEAVKASDKTADFEAYLQKYPTGKFAATARERMKRLTAAPVASPPGTAGSPPRTAAGSPPNSQESLPVEVVIWTNEELNQRAIKKVTPFYPRRARDARVKGLVKVRVDVSEAGKVTFAKAISGPAILHGAAEQAALQWLFRPAERAGAPVKAQGVVAFNFVP
jgi:TonB family protein